MDPLGGPPPGIHLKKMKALPGKMVWNPPVTQSEGLRASGASVAPRTTGQLQELPAGHANSWLLSEEPAPMGKDLTWKPCLKQPWGLTTSASSRPEARRLCSLNHAPGDLPHTLWTSKQEIGTH